MAFGDIIQRAELGEDIASATITKAFASTPVSGNLLVAIHMTGATSCDSCSSASGSYSSAFHWQNATDLDAARLWYRIAGASEATSVSAVASAVDEQGLLLLEIEGPWNAAPVDQTTDPGRQALGGFTYGCGTTGTTTQANEVAVAAMYSRSSANVDAAISFDNAFVHDNAACVVSTFKSITAGTKLLSATGTVTTTCTFGTAAVTQGGIVTFKKETAPSGVTLNRIVRPRLFAPGVAR